MFLKIGVLTNYAIFTGKLTGNLRKTQENKLQHRCFPVNIAKFFRTALL